jgi:tRNA(Ile)-lysidine synthase
MDGNLEQNARTVRHGFYAELLASGAVDRIATGHTRSDQAETVLYRILRGSGLTGLSGILPVTREGLVRPLLEIDRCEIEAWLLDRGIAWREDQTNHDITYSRNRLRHQVLPQLRAGFNPQVDQALAHIATLCRDEEVFWETEMARHFPPGTSHHPTVLPISLLADAPQALARRLIRRAIEIAKGDLRGIDYNHIERVIEMAHRSDGHDRMQAPGLDVCRSFDWIRFAPTPIQVTASHFALPVTVPASVELPGSGSRITLQVLDKSSQPTQGLPCVKVVDELDWQRLRRGEGAPSLELRNWRPGDQYRKAGRSKAEKVKFFFQEARVPLWERRDWPIITLHGQILWARRFGPAAEFAIGPQTRSILRIAETGP